MAAMATTKGALLLSLLLVLLLVPFVFFLSSSSLQSSPRFLLPFTSQLTKCPTKPSSPPPLRVFMYDLPPRFHLAMLSSSGGGESPAASFPPWPASSGIKRQHSVEYWMMASLVAGDGEESGGKEVIRVSHAEMAEAFFVPFFSSLSFNVHGKNMTDPDTKADRQLQVELMDILWKSKYWKRSAGRDHVIPMHHPNAFRFLRDMVNTSILIVADFGRYPKNVASLRKDVVAPYVHVVPTFLNDDPLDPYGSRPTLLFFRGRTVRKAEGKVRSKLAKILKGNDDVHFEDSLATGQGIKASIEGMRSSKFCLHPAGDTPSSCRLFDAIVSHCVPVIVSDRIELPFEDEIDYTEFSLFFSVKEALQPNYLIDHLRQIPKERWVEMWLKLKNVSHHYEFQQPAKKGDAVNMIWQQVRRKLPAVNLAVHRSRRLKITDWWR